MEACEIKQYCLSLAGSDYDFKEEWNAERALVGGKMYAMITHNKLAQPIITLKSLPENGRDLRLQYPEQITEGYYMNKVHWISIRRDQDIPVDLMKSLISDSYNLIWNSLSSKVKETLIQK